MRHPLRAVIPPVQSTTRQTKRDESHNHNNLDNPTLHSSITCFSAHTSFTLPSLRSFLQSVRSLKTTHNPSSQESSFFLHGSHNNSTDFRKGQKFLIFAVSGPISQLIRSLQGSTSQILSQISTGRKCKGKHPTLVTRIVILPSQLRHRFVGLSERVGPSLLFGRKTSNSSHWYHQKSITSLVFCLRSLQTFGSPVLNLRLFGSQNVAYSVLHTIAKCHKKTINTTRNSTNHQSNKWKTTDEQHTAES